MLDLCFDHGRRYKYTACVCFTPGLRVSFGRVAYSLAWPDHNFFTGRYHLQYERPLNILAFILQAITCKKLWSGLARLGHFNMLNSSDKCPASKKWSGYARPIISEIVV